MRGPALYPLILSLWSPIETDLKSISMLERLRLRPVLRNSCGVVELVPDSMEKRGKGTTKGLA